MPARPHGAISEFRADTAYYGQSDAPIIAVYKEGEQAAEKTPTRRAKIDPSTSLLKAG